MWMLDENGNLVNLDLISRIMVHWSGEDSKKYTHAVYCVAGDDRFKMFRGTKLECEQKVTVILNYLISKGRV